MTSMPASRSARAITLAPRSCPSSPGFATNTRIGRVSSMWQPLFYDPECLSYLFFPFAIDQRVNIVIGVNLGLRGRENGLFVSNDQNNVAAARQANIAQRFANQRR